MRYWIYWNDLVQGPFELDELATLKALSEDLPVCMEDRTDWLPACRIADLAPIIEQLRSMRLPPPPPPPPPSGPPARDVIQGELFTDPPEQETFFPTPGTPKGPFTLSDGAAEMHAGVFTEVRVTSPFQFSGDHRPLSLAPRMTPPVQALPPIMPIETMMPLVTKESPLPAVESHPEPLNHARIPLEIYPDIPEVEELPPLAAVAPAPRLESAVEAPAAVAAASAPELPPLNIEPVPADASSTRLMAWAAGVLIGLMLLGSIAYKLFDFSTSRSAIEEASRRQHPPAHTEPPLAMPLTPAALPVVTPTPAPPPAGSVPIAAVEMPSGSPRAPSTSTKHAARSHAMKAAKKAVHATPKKAKAPVHAVVPAAPEAGPGSASSVAPIPMAQAPMPATPVSAPTPHPIPTSTPAQATPSASATNTAPAPAKKQSLLGKIFKKKAPASRAPTTFAGFGGTPSVPAVAPVAVPVPAPSAAAPEPATPAKPDLWLNKHNEAITLVMNKKIGTTPQSVSARARVMLEEMHDRELLNAADTGKRLYLPDKIEWSALRENGAIYRVYMNFSALQATGERVQTLSYQFAADLEHRTVSSDDKTAQADFLNATTILTHKREQRAADIENILSAVDNLNKHKMRALVVKDNRKNKAEGANIQAGIKRAQEKLDRALAYFRTKYPDTMLQNVAQAYDFTDLVHAHV